MIWDDMINACYENIVVVIIIYKGRSDTGMPNENIDECF